MKEEKIPVSNEHGACPYTANIPRAACQNQNFRTAFWTGEYLQMTLMEIPPCGEIGLEVHNDTEQFIRVEHGRAVVKMGVSPQRMEFQQYLCQGDAVFVPMGVWHNIINAGRVALKVSSIYAPPHHPSGTVHRTKRNAEKASY